MKRFISILLGLALSAALGLGTLAQSVSVPLPLAVIQGSDGLNVEQLFVSLRQGAVGLLRLRGENIQDARVLFNNRSFRFIPETTNEWYALVVADFNLQAREYPYSVLVRLNDERTQTLEGRLSIESAGFIRQNFNIPADRAFLADPEVERNEFARLAAVTEVQRSERLWDSSGFRLPIDTEFVSGFGQYRILNQSVQTRHTGWDQRAATGTPIGAIAAGEVIFSGQLDIRGNYIMLDHGWGIYSGYAHFSQVFVERGQRIEQGQILGLSGNTGRSQGPHLHWEIIVAGEWVDGVPFLDLWLPGRG